MLLFAPHVTKSIVKKPPRLGVANKLIGPMNLSFLFRVMQVYLLLHSECFDGRSRTQIQFSDVGCLLRVKLPFKVLTFVLKLLNDSLPMRREFAKTSFINDASFPFCATIEESLDYLLITYELHSQFRIGLLFGWIECTRHKTCHHFTFILAITCWPIGSIKNKLPA